MHVLGHLDLCCSVRPAHRLCVTSQAVRRPRPPCYKRP
jgi:hypothetical protein